MTNHTIQALEQRHQKLFGNTYTLFKAQVLNKSGYQEALLTALATGSALTDFKLGITFPRGAEQ